jgi:hypothetical protein
VLREQVMESVARHLAGEASEARAHEVGVVTDQRDRTLGERTTRSVRALADPQAAAVAGDEVETAHVVDRATEAEGARTARVVPDHPAEAAAVVRGRVGSEAQPVRCGRALEVVEHDARIDVRDAGLEVDRADPIDAARQVEHEARADRVARDRGPASAWGDRNAEIARDGHRSGDIVRVARERHGHRRDAVERSVVGVLGATAARGVDVDTDAHEGTDQLARAVRHVAELSAPSTLIAVPDTYDARSEARNAITSATSSASPTRPSGMPRREASPA